MKTKADIVANWLPRYTDTPLDGFGKYILLTNFLSYVDEFARSENVEVRGLLRPMQTATSADGITIINFGIGSPNAATACDVLSAVQPKAVLLLGKCGGLKHKLQVGDFILPIAAIRAEGTSDSYYPKEVPALPSFRLQMAVSHTIVAHEQDYYTGTVYTTNRRVWEHDEEFKGYRVNTVVDINNLISLETLHSAGTFNLEHLQPPIVFRVGQPDESYSGIGRGEIKIEGLPVFADQLGPFGSTTSDSERAMIRLETTRIMMVIISFLGSEGMEAALQRAAGLLERYVAASDIEVGVVE